MENFVFSVDEEPANDQWLAWKEVKDLVLMDAYIDRSIS